jgi:hypothetical protein
LELWNDLDPQFYAYPEDLSSLLAQFLEAGKFPKEGKKLGPKRQTTKLNVIYWR